MDNRRFLLDRLRGASGVVFSVINCQISDDGTITVEEGREMAGRGYVAGYVIRVKYPDRYAVYMDSEDGIEGGKVYIGDDREDDSSCDLDVSTVFDAFEKWKQLPQVRTRTIIRDDVVEIKYYLCDR